MPKPLRAFVAVPLPAPVIDFLQQIQQQLHSPMINVRWVRPENIHLTLKFLGDIEPSQVPVIGAQLDAAAVSMPAFTLNARGVGVFPNRRKPRVLWVGLDGETGMLKMLQTTVETALAAVGFKKEKRAFRAHLTIGRPRKRMDPDDLGGSLDRLQTAALAPFRVGRVCLYQSVLKPSGAEYTVLYSAPLSD
ncbi:RNA 2',3'-cyclic phosphodiesterase [Desulfosarcina ovata]|uniref:RNA 2',3'-cyclic phosphodiesterase n=1 Tax=Desulfosarcina ovata subsp. ovata TaxID=2752305 RepID=A0A5K8A3M7_9BACT|nr:RNA 2',3'-cyclic phosphodiesterase [Desulfosarcina ovata]BBO86944.1 RNA 2',3'-cyclic phosphodiesterase [Desulfosarcina ovata subsp. ovata]